MKSLILVACLLLGSLDLHSQRVAPLVYPIDRKDFTNPDQLTFLGPILRDVEVVSLGESIHMTHEFPLVRLGIIRLLNEQLGNHLLVIEGSAPDVWIAQDRFLNSPRTAQDAQEALGGFFGLWSTSEMRRLLEYEAESWRSSHPLYIAGYDIHAGNGRCPQGIEVFRLLIDRLSTYVAPPPGFDSAQWMRNVEPIVRGEDYHSSLHASVEAAIRTLEEWIDRAAPEIEKRFSNVPHTSALRLIPENLRAVLKLRDDLAKPNPQGYQGLRDINAAAYVFQMKRNLALAKFMLWAHISHLHNDNDQGPASVGGILRRSLGWRLYTIAPLAESGGAILIFPGAGNEDIGYGRVHGARDALGQRLSSLSEEDYFLDLRSLPTGPSADPVFWTQQPVWIESGQRRWNIAREFDGIVWVKTVHAPDLTPLVLVFSMIHYRKVLSVFGIGLALIVVLLPIYFFFRWRKRPRGQATKLIGIGLLAVRLCAGQQAATDQAEILALSNAILRDSAELAMVVQVSNVVTDSKGVEKRRSQSSVQFVFHGYNRQAGRFSLNSRSGWFNTSALRDSLTGNFVAFGAFSRLASSVHPQPTGLLIRSPAENCQVFEILEGLLYPKRPCASVEFKLVREADGNLMLESFTSQIGSLPAPAKIPYLGAIEIQSIRAEGEIQKIYLQPDPRPFIIPKRVITSVQTDKGKIILTNVYSLKPIPIRK